LLMGWRSTPRRNGTEMWVTSLTSLSDKISWYSYPTLPPQHTQALSNTVQQEGKPRWNEKSHLHLGQLNDNDRQLPFGEGEWWVLQVISCLAPNVFIFAPLKVKYSHSESQQTCLANSNRDSGMSPTQRRM